MLRKCTRDEFESGIDLAYGLALDPTRSGYPTYCDMIKTKEMFTARSLEAFESETEEMLLFEYGGKAAGFIHLFFIPEDKYISTVCFNIESGTEQALAEFIAYVGERFAGYELLLGFPAENRRAADYLAANGFACIERACNNTAFPQSIAHLSEPSGIITVGRGNFGLFSELHARYESDMYWTSERISAALDDWVILACAENGIPCGAVYYMKPDDGRYEIFGVDIASGACDTALTEKLLNAALFDAKRRGAGSMTFFCDEQTEKSALASGFAHVGDYVCYRKCL